MNGAPHALVADVGATRCRFALARAAPHGPQLRLLRCYEDSAFSGFEAALEAYLAEARAVPVTFAAACFAAAGPVAGDRVQLTNRDWGLDGATLSSRLGVPVAIANDFACAARGIQWLAPSDLSTLQPGEPEPRAPRVVIGAGTGLGVAYLVPAASDWIVIAGEGGHAGFAPQSEEQAALWRWLRAARGRVAAEDVLSGAGIAAIHGFLLGEPPGARAPQQAATVQHAAGHGDPVAARALDLFCEIYGAVAGDHALAVLALGGVYVAGGIAARILDRLRAGGFVRAFTAKGVHAAILRRVPVHVVVGGSPELLGAAAIALDLHQSPRGTAT